MSKKFVIHLTEKYSNPIVQVNSMVLHSPDQQNYTFYAPNTTESYTLKVSCEGFQEYELIGITDKLVEITLKPPENVAGIVVGVLSALALVVGAVLTIMGKEDHEKNRDEKYKYSNLFGSDDEKSEYGILGTVPEYQFYGSNKKH